MSEQVEDFPRDEAHRFRIYRWCDDPACEGTGKIDGERCRVCKGEGKIRDCLAACPTAEDLGVALVQLGREGEFTGCATGCLDVLGEPHQKWLWMGWLPSPRNISDAGRVLASGRKATP